MNNFSKSITSVIENHSFVLKQNSIFIEVLANIADIAADLSQNLDDGNIEIGAAIASRLREELEGIRGVLAAFQAASALA